MRYLKTRAHAVVRLMMGKMLQKENPPLLHVSISRRANPQIIHVDFFNLIAFYSVVNPVVFSN